MTRNEFVNKLAKQLKRTQKETSSILNEFSSLLTQTLRRGDQVGLPIGKFQLKHRPARTGINPSTRARIQVAPKVIPAFKPSKKFKQAVLE